MKKSFDLMITHSRHSYRIHPTDCPCNFNNNLLNFLLRSIVIFAYIINSLFDLKICELFILYIYWNWNYWLFFIVVLFRKYWNFTSLLVALIRIFSFCFYCIMLLLSFCISPLQFLTFTVRFIIFSRSFTVIKFLNSWPNCSSTRLFPIFDFGISTWTGKTR